MSTVFSVELHLSSSYPPSLSLFLPLFLSLFPSFSLSPPPLSPLSSLSPSLFPCLSLCPLSCVTLSNFVSMVAAKGVTFGDLDGSEVRVGIISTRCARPTIICGCALTCVHGVYETRKEAVTLTFTPICSAGARGQNRRVLHQNCVQRSNAPSAATQTYLRTGSTHDSATN